MSLSLPSFNQSFQFPTAIPIANGHFPVSPSESANQFIEHSIASNHTLAHGVTEVELSFFHQPNNGISTSRKPKSLKFFSRSNVKRGKKITSSRGRVGSSRRPLRSRNKLSNGRRKASNLSTNLASVKSSNESNVIQFHLKLPSGGADIKSNLTMFPDTGKLVLPKELNSTLFHHIPVLWTALSIALGLEARGEVIRGLPCITRFNQLFCRSGGTSYPSDLIERFIDDNKALIRRMYGEFIGISVLTDSLRSGRKRRAVIEAPIPDHEYFDLASADSFFGPLRDNTLKVSEEGEDDVFLTVHNNTDIPATPGRESAGSPYVNISRKKRQTRRNSRKRQTAPGPLPKSDRMDSCESEEEVATPYWASNSRGKILAIVNTNEFSQIIHQEICTKQSTHRCNNDCGCEQKYKYHRLMAYDPANDCKGIFMDWFLFPSCCTCRCDPT